MSAHIVSVDLNAPRIIPLPRDWRILEGAYELPQQIAIGYRGDGAEEIARCLAGRPADLKLYSCSCGEVSPHHMCYPYHISGDPYTQYMNQNLAI